MKDHKGMEIHVGDTVLCSGGKGKFLQERVVVHVSAKTCWVCTKVTLWDYSYEEVRKNKSLWKKKVEGQVLILHGNNPPVK